MPYDVWVDENDCYPGECRCGHNWLDHHMQSHTGPCMRACGCNGFREREET